MIQAPSETSLLLCITHNQALTPTLSLLQLAPKLLLLLRHELSPVTWTNTATLTRSLGLQQINPHMYKKFAKIFNMTFARAPRTKSALKVEPSPQRFSSLGQQLCVDIRSAAFVFGATGSLPRRMHAMVHTALHPTRFVPPAEQPTCSHIAEQKHTAA